jgi:hypothetical protein
MESASATLRKPLDSSKHIIAQLLCPVQRSLMQGFHLSASFVRQSGGSEGECLVSIVIEDWFLD